ncbi:MAG: hypothetical protein EZS28_005847 [Streblomastix strix]|uniref:Uncharacterized protein n=1 Tax=Streblomastix strix TaxID=222440 RepID=A0A5J4WUB8_9EUKA|nr:MAG: hypothetical protein EZS28_005847 [Streblomastix strix]
MIQFLPHQIPSRILTLLHHPSKATAVSATRFLRYFFTICSRGDERIVVKDQLIPHIIIALAQQSRRDGMVLSALLDLLDYFAVDQNKDQLRNDFVKWIINVQIVGNEKKSIEEGSQTVKLGNEDVDIDFNTNINEEGRQGINKQNQSEDGNHKNILNKYNTLDLSETFTKISMNISNKADDKLDLQDQTTNLQGMDKDSNPLASPSPSKQSTDQSISSSQMQRSDQTNVNNKKLNKMQRIEKKKEELMKFRPILLLLRQKPIISSAFEKIYAAKIGLNVINNNNKMNQQNAYNAIMQKNVLINRINNKNNKNSSNNNSSNLLQGSDLWFIIDDQLGQLDYRRKKQSQSSLHTYLNKQRKSGKQKQKFRKKRDIRNSLDENSQGIDSIFNKGKKSQGLNGAKIGVDSNYSLQIQPEDEEGEESNDNDQEQDQESEDTLDDIIDQEFEDNYFSDKDKDENEIDEADMSGIDEDDESDEADQNDDNISDLSQKKKQLKKLKHDQKLLKVRQQQILEQMQSRGNQSISEQGNIHVSTPIRYNSKQPQSSSSSPYMSPRLNVKLGGMNSSLMDKEEIYASRRKSLQRENDDKEEDEAVFSDEDDNEEGQLKSIQGPKDQDDEDDDGTPLRLNIKGGDEDDEEDDDEIFLGKKKVKKEGNANIKIQIGNKGQQQSNDKNEIAKENEIHNNEMRNQTSDNNEDEEEEEEDEENDGSIIIQKKKRKRGDFEQSNDGKLKEKADNKWKSISFKIINEKEMDKDLSSASSNESLSSSDLENDIENRSDGRIEQQRNNQDITFDQKQANYKKDNIKKKKRKKKEERNNLRKRIRYTNDDTQNIQEQEQEQNTNQKMNGNKYLHELADKDDQLAQAVTFTSQTNQEEIQQYGDFEYSGSLSSSLHTIPIPQSQSSSSSSQTQYSSSNISPNLTALSPLSDSPTPKSPVLHLNSSIHDTHTGPIVAPLSPHDSVSITQMDVVDIGPEKLTQQTIPSKHFKNMHK